MLCKYHPVLIPEFLFFFLSRGSSFNRFRSPWEFFFSFFLFWFFFLRFCFLILLFFKHPTRVSNLWSPIHAFTMHEHSISHRASSICMHVLSPKKTLLLFSFLPHPPHVLFDDEKQISYPDFRPIFPVGEVGEASVKCTYFLVRCPFSFSLLSYQYPILGVLLLNREFFRRGEAHLISQHSYAGIFPYDT